MDRYNVCDYFGCDLFDGTLREVAIFLGKTESQVLMAAGSNRPISGLIVKGDGKEFIRPPSMRYGHPFQRGIIKKHYEWLAGSKND